MRKIKRLRGMIALMPALCLSAACGNTGALEIGFDRGGRLPSLMAAAKSDHAVFEIDDVTLDFYFGGYADEYSPDQERISFGVALYFCNEEAYSALELDAPYADYRTLDGLYFTEFIDAETFNAGGYEAEADGWWRVSFQHCETMTVPSEVFPADDDHFGLAMLNLYRLKDQTGYYIGYQSCLEIKYESDGQSVKLSKPAHRFK